MAVYTGENNVHPFNVRATKDTKTWILCKLEYLEMKFFFRCVTTCRVIVLDHVTSKAQPGSLDKASHMSGIVTRRWLFIEMTAKTPCVVSSSYKTSKTLGDAWLVVPEAAVGLKRRPPLSVRGWKFSGRFFWFSSKSVVSHSLLPEVFGTRPCFLDLSWPSYAHRIQTWLWVTGRWLFSKCV